MWSPWPTSWRTISAAPRASTAAAASGRTSVLRRIARTVQRERADAGNPPRRSGWEIHPVYSIEVCEFKTLATCRFDREDVWIPLADWLLIE